MLHVSLDTRKFTKDLDEAGSRQVPFAQMKAINKTATDAQGAMRERIRDRFTVRRDQFVTNTVKINRGDFATRQNPRAILRIDPDRNILAKFEEGGRKEPREGSSIAIPVEARRNKADIVTKGDRPKAYQLRDVTSGAGVRIAKGLKRTFMIRSADGRGGLFQRVGRGAGSSIRELFAFKRSVPIPRRLEFFATVRRTAAEKFPVKMRDALERAFRTAR